MESILVWTLVTAAIAIILMLVLLIASERDIKRKRAEVESLRARLESAGPAAETRLNLVAEENMGISAEVAALTEQVRSSEVTIATLQCELEALRAENSWLKQESACYQTKNPELETRVAESFPTPRVEQLAAPAADYRLDLGPRKSRLLFPATALALLLVALVSVYFARGWQKAPLAPARQVESRAAGQANESLARLNAISAADSDQGKSDENAASKTIPSKKTPPVGASYEVVRSTRVFSQPNESSRPLARIEAGMEINVVGTRDEWLEVRSRHGRPPGFIRKDAAVMKGLK